MPSTVKASVIDDDDDATPYQVAAEKPTRKPRKARIEQEQLRIRGEVTERPIDGGSDGADMAGVVAETAIKLIIGM